MIRHFRLLAWLRWKYLWRTTGRSRQIGAVLTIVVSLGISAGLFAFSSLILDKLFDLEDLSGTWELVHLAFAVLYVFWLYSGSFNDLYDPARLASFPLSPRTLFLGSTLSSFIGVTSILGGALLAGFAVGIPGTAGERILRAGLFLFLLVHLQMLSRLIRLTFLAVLTSRRWRDAAVLVSTLIGGGVYMTTQLLPREADKLAAAIRSFANSGGPSHWLAWCPAVWLSWAYQLEGIRSIAGFSAFAILTVLIHRAGGWAEHRLAFSDPIFHYRPKKKTSAKRVPFLRGVSRALLGIAGPAAAAVARKELAVFFRDPAVRHRVLTSFFYILLPFVMFFMVRSGDSNFAFELGGFFLLFAEMIFLTNVFGMEGAAVRNLLWFPVRRRHVFVGKNVAYFALFAPFNAAVLILLAVFSGAPGRIPSMLASHFTALLIVMGLGNLTSVYFPFPFLTPGRRSTRQEESGCMKSAARLLLFIVTTILLAPVLAAVFLLDKSPWLIAVSIVGIAYAAGLYLIGLGMAERALLKREEALGDDFRAA